MTFLPSPTLVLPRAAKGMVVVGRLASACPLAVALGLCCLIATEPPSHRKGVVSQFENVSPAASWTSGCRRPCG